jgi:hypothetical protein
MPVNYTRLGVAALAATLVDIVYGFVVYGIALAREVSMYGGIFRRVEEINAKWPWLVAGLILAMLAASFVYAKAYEPGSGIWRGARFGVVIGLLVVGYVAIGNYVVLRIGQRLAVFMAAAALGEWIAIGITIGAVYKPIASTPRR